ncbi:hypothetical protein E4U53_007746 [Claviceps sorghi]|nr:hypothetical protein E4U53_007746 [Claviceps sorghi]
MPEKDTKSFSTTERDDKSSDQSEKNDTASSPDCSDVEVGTARVVDLRGSTTPAEAKQLSASGLGAQRARIMGQDR